MHKIYTIIITALTLMAVQSCSKKTLPSAPVAHTDTTVVRIEMPADTDTTLVAKKNDSLVVTKPVIKRKVKESIPRVIVVNDKFAKKSVDGRYYYDLQGHRYWRNNKDGKYYLFNKSMLTDDAFKKPN